jgi:hypothetical protein
LKAGDSVNFYEQLWGHSEPGGGPQNSGSLVPSHRASYCYSHRSLHQQHRALPRKCNRYESMIVDYRDHHCCIMSIIIIFFTVVVTTVIVVISGVPINSIGPSSPSQMQSV